MPSFKSLLKSPQKINARSLGSKGAAAPIDADEEVIKAAASSRIAAVCIVRICGA